VKKVIFIFLVVSCLFHSARAQECLFRLTGHVHSTATHENLPGATVQLAGSQKIIITNQNGDFLFDSLCAGTYTISIRHANYTEITRVIKLTKDAHLDLDLVPVQNVLQNVTITGTRTTQPGGIKTEITGRELEEHRGFSLAEALSKTTGVTILQTGSTISKPVIHGLHSNRILILNNGVRQEGQQWGSEHAPEIDPFIAGSLTVVKGASSLRYGADAIAGAVLVEPKALPTDEHLHAEVNTHYHSNNRQYLANAVVEQNLKSLPALSWRLQGTYKRGGNTRTPNYWLNNTGLQEVNYSATVGWRKARYQAEAFFSSFNTTLGIFTGSHIGNVTDLEAAIASPKPIQNINAFSYDIGRPKQEVLHYLVKLRNSFIFSNEHRLTLTLAHQENFRKEFDRALITDRPELDLNIGTTTADLLYEVRKRISTSYGLFAMRQENVWSGSRFFIPNFLTWNFSGYATARTNVSEKTKFEAGLRYDFRTLETYRNQNNQLTQINRNFNNISATVLADHSIKRNLNFVLAGSLAWRPPQVNELYVNGLHHGTASFEVGDPNLNSEVAYNFSAQLKKNHDSAWSFDFTAYTNYINQYINLVPVQPPTLTLRGAYPTFRYEQTNAIFYGLDAAVSRKLTNRLAATVKSSLLWARDLGLNDWLQQMPSNRYEAELTYQINKEHQQDHYFTFNLMHVERQTRVPSNRKDYLPPPPAYTLVNIETGTMFHLFEKRIDASLGVRNLLNTTYREYMNRFRYFNDEAGRNIVLRLKYQL